MLCDSLILVESLALSDLLSLMLVDTLSEFFELSLSDSLLDSEFFSLALLLSDLLSINDFHSDYFSLKRSETDVDKDSMRLFASEAEVYSDLSLLY